MVVLRSGGALKSSGLGTAVCSAALVLSLWHTARHRYHVVHVRSDSRVHGPNGVVFRGLAYPPFAAGGAHGYHKYLLSGIHDFAMGGLGSELLGVPSHVDSEFGFWGHEMRKPRVLVVHSRDQRAVVGGCSCSDDRER